MLRFAAIRAQQSSSHQVLSFAATAEQVMAIASIDRVKRDESGQLRGFQRPLVSKHIREIRDYLERPDSVMPNAIVLAFTSGIRVTDGVGSYVEVEVDVSSGPVGFVVDGQQRLSAMAGLPGRDFQLLVSALICDSPEELRRQFILVNNTSPLPKSLIYELLPGVGGLPKRMTARAQAARVVELLNFDARSSLQGQIKLHTNPLGIIGDTSMQKVVMNSLSDGYCRTVIDLEEGEEKCFLAVSEFFAAVQDVFKSAWFGHTPRTSRLVHSAGIISMGYVMDQLCSQGQPLRPLFKLGLKRLEGRTAWTAGQGSWEFQSGARSWNAIQNLHGDIHVLSDYLTRLIRKEIVAPSIVVAHRV
ncbi:DGQHR domain-containing protein DpdB [Pseudomonas aeruginosa]|uniref:DGQHR domain-containing protein DpdB n=1 Tax=Pseudomonas aeruginosa TaxID=287 RepID=UPI002E2DB9AC|nr:DGQHR domain-containing protein DpdB [Pseudomonas aeruginosa]HBO2098453.1 DGQHR domain-containing protein [Pseudomonas aeruginosa]